MAKAGKQSDRVREKEREGEGGSETASVGSAANSSPLGIEDGLRLRLSRCLSWTHHHFPCCSAGCEFSFCIFFIFSNCQKLLTRCLSLPCTTPSPCCLISQSTWSLTFPFSFPCELQLKSWPWHSSKVPSPISLPAPCPCPSSPPAHSHFHSHQSGSHRHEHCRQDAQIFIGSREFFISTVAGSQAGGVCKGSGVCLCVCVCVWVSARVAECDLQWVIRPLGWLSCCLASPRIASCRLARPCSAVVVVVVCVCQQTDSQ